MFFLVLTMSKRIKYFLASLVNCAILVVVLLLPYEVRYYGLLMGVLGVIATSWFALSLALNQSLYIRFMSILLPTSFFIGYSLFVVLLPYSFFLSLILGIFCGLITYVVYLIENVFLIAIGFRTVPLYRAAYTMSLIVLLVTSFFLFNTMFSFNLIYWANGILAFVISAVIFAYHFFSVTIELADDGEGKDIKAYIFLPAWLMSQLAIILSFWPVGIFKGSIYLVCTIYVIVGLLQSDLRERLFKKTWMSFLWIGIAVILGIIVMTGWR